MQRVILKALPVTRVGVLATHPEPHHLQVLWMMALRCGKTPIYVEHGVTNGQVTHVLLEAMKLLPGASLHLLGEIPEHVLKMVEESECAERVDLNPPRQKPSLWFCGRPEYALQVVEQAEAAESRVIVIYDWRTAERFGLNRFIPSAQAARKLMANPARAWNSLCDSLQGQHTRRGMLIAELRQWRPGETEEAEEAPLPLPPPVEVPAPPTSRFGRLGSQSKNLPDA